MSYSLSCSRRKNVFVFKSGSLLCKNVRNEDETQYCQTSVISAVVVVLSITNTHTNTNREENTNADWLIEEEQPGRPNFFSFGSSSPLLLRQLILMPQLFIRGWKHPFFYTKNTNTGKKHNCRLVYRTYFFSFGSSSPLLSCIS